MKKQEYAYSGKKKKGNPVLTAILVFLIIGFIGSKSSSNETPAATTAPTKVPTISATQKAAVAPTSTPTTKPTEAPTATPVATKKASPLFTMFSDDTVGATKHIVVGGEYEPSGRYEVVCTSGHGVLTVNDKGFCFAVDEYKGQENGTKTYEESIIITLNDSDKLTLRSYHSTTLKLKFYYIGE